MSFARPDLLWLAAALPLAVALGVFGYVRRRRRVLDALGEPALLSRLGLADLAASALGRFLLLGIAAAALGLAAAGPRWGLRTVESRTSAVSVVLALDVSRSMLARDVEPDRLERERLLARQLLRELRGERVGLVVFAGRAYVLSPLTVDHGALELYLDALDPEVVSQGGSSLASALTQAVDLARAEPEMGGGRAVILVSDGEALEERDDVLAMAERAARLGIPVHTVGVGTREGAPVPEVNLRSGAVVGYKRDEAGEIVVSRLGEELLRGVAEITGGTYVQLGEGQAIDRMVAGLRRMDRAEVAGGRAVEERERFAWFVALALLCLAADTLLARRRMAVPAGQEA